MEPTCARVILSGKVKQVCIIRFWEIILLLSINIKFFVYIILSQFQLTPGSKEFEFGQNAFISRHPAAENWLKGKK